MYVHAQFISISYTHSCSYTHTYACHLCMSPSLVCSPYPLCVCVCALLQKFHGRKFHDFIQNQRFAVKFCDFVQNQPCTFWGKTFHKVKLCKLGQIEKITNYIPRVIFTLYCTIAQGSSAVEQTVGAGCRASVPAPPCSTHRTPARQPDTSQRGPSVPSPVY